MSAAGTAIDDGTWVQATDLSAVNVLFDSTQYADAAIQVVNGYAVLNGTPLAEPAPVNLAPSTRYESDIAMTIGTDVQPDGKVIAVSILAPEVVPSEQGNRWDFLISPRFDRLSFTRFNADGTVDTTFGDQGTTTYLTGTGLSEIMNGGIVTDAQGRMVIPQSGSLFRFNADATIDTSFGVNGEVSLSGVSGLDVTSDGRIVVAAGQKIIRLNADGSTDESFSPYTLSVGNLPWQWASFKDVSVAADGSVYAVGEIRTENMGPDDLPMSTAFLTKLHSDGTLDTTFATDGRYELGQADRKWESFDAVEVLSDGRIQVLGHFTWLKPWETRPRPDDIYIDASGTVLARFNPDGSLDQTYGENGLVLDKSSALDNVFGMLVLDDGRVVSSTYGNEGGRILVVSADGLQRTVLEQAIDFDSSNPRPYYDTTTAPPSLAPDGSIVAGVRLQNMHNADEREAADTFWVRINLDGSGGGTNAPVVGEAGSAPRPTPPDVISPTMIPGDVMMPTFVPTSPEAPDGGPEQLTLPGVDAGILIFNTSSGIASLSTGDRVIARLFAGKRDDDLLAGPEEVIS